MSADDDAIPLDFQPCNAVELEMCLADPMWRVCSGYLYQILIKSNEGEDGKVMAFKPNRAQRRLINRLWHRNLILKARQLGFTTLIAILWLDHALFNANQRCAIIAQDLPAAQAIFRDKVRFAYDNLPPELLAAFPLKQDSQTELLFAHNNSSVKVATSVRSGTIDRLHVSEFGKICAKFPLKASEIITGSLPAVPLDGIAVIESTAEGQGGEFHAMSKIAEALSEKKGHILTVREWRFHFYAWHDNPEYQIDPTGVLITPKDHEYFDQVEAALNKRISLRQRAWYCATRNADFSGSPEKMWQEYPSTSREAFQQSTEGTYYAVQLAQARKEGRIGRVPLVSNVPVNTFWDIGASDGTAIWFHQKIGAENRFVRFEEAWGEPYSYFVKLMQAMGYVWGVHYLPHDADHKRQQGHRVSSPKEELETLAPGWQFEIVPRVDEVTHGIQLTRAAFSTYYFDETACAAGIAHLGSYKKEWDNRLAVWKATPRHDEHSEASDALRQHAQGFHEHAVKAGSRPKRRNKSGAVA